MISNKKITWEGKVAAWLRKLRYEIISLIQQYPGTCLVLIFLMLGLCNDHNLELVGL